MVIHCLVNQCGYNCEHLSNHEGVVNSYTIANC